MGDLNRLERVLIAHNPVPSADDPATADVLAQVAMVEAALAELGIESHRVSVEDGRAWDLATHAPATFPLSRSGGRGGQGVRVPSDQGVRVPSDQGVRAVFHLVESLPGAPEACAASAAALAALGLPFTGSPAAALWLTTDKTVTRAVLAAAGLPVAPGGRLDFATPDLRERMLDRVLGRIPPPWILKPACEDASVGLEGDDPLCRTREEALARAAELARRFPGQPVLAEAFLPGRELNVSLLAGPEGVEVLPVAELVYEDFPADVPKVLGYDAKWRPGSFLYEHTVRRFPGPGDPLTARAVALARQAWEVCGLAGYARVDLRCDEAGEPHILEVNANPCLAPDAGFLAAAAEAGLRPRDVVERILRAALPDTAEAPAEPAPARRPLPDLALRDLRPADRAALEALLQETGFFNPEELAVALELVDDRLAQGTASHYQFLVGELDGQVAGYACWGAIPGTLHSADLYWIAVAPRHQGRGAGAALLAAAEQQAAAAGRHRIYVETSTRSQYDPTRAFYRARGYRLEAELRDYYAPGDGKAVFVRVVG
jgi:D-alanine-D-alanine ligase